VIWMNVQQDGIYVNMNASIHKAAINVHVLKATIKLEINVQVNNFSILRGISGFQMFKYSFLFKEIL
jgi:hypothetical protein